MKDYYAPGDWNAVCAVCGFKHKASQLRERWDGQRVCEKDFEVRHPSDLIRVPTDDPSVPWTSPESTDTFVAVGYIVVDQAIVDIVIVA
jgi:hypothetical protein